jgi:hypothetical protein
MIAIFLLIIREKFFNITGLKFKHLTNRIILLAYPYLVWNLENWDLFSFINPTLDTKEGQLFMEKLVLKNNIHFLGKLVEAGKITKNRAYNAFTRIPRHIVNAGVEHVKFYLQDDFGDHMWFLEQSIIFKNDSVFNYLADEFHADPYKRWILYHGNCDIFITACTHNNLTALKKAWEFLKKDGRINRIYEKKDFDKGTKFGDVFGHARFFRRYETMEFLKSIDFAGKWK